MLRRGNDDASTAFRPLIRQLEGVPDVLDLRQVMLVQQDSDHIEARLGIVELSFGKPHQRCLGNLPLLEGGNGELGFYLISDGSRVPYRLHFRRPCFIYYQAYPEMVTGNMLSDAVITLSSMNVIAGELDA